MYCINVKEQFDVYFMKKTPIFRQQGFNVFQAHSVFEAMLSFTIVSYIHVCSHFQWKIFTLQLKEIDLSLVYRKKVISAFKVNQKIVGSRYSFQRKSNDLSLASQAIKRKPPFCLCGGANCAWYSVQQRCAMQYRGVTLSNVLWATKIKTNILGAF